MISIRPEKDEDTAVIAELNRAAFKGPGEADLVDALRAANALTLSLVAVDDDEIIGHIAFSPVTIESETETAGAIGLAPMSVQPDRQESGIGSRLVEAGLIQIAAMGHAIVVVLGHPEYYPRFGFTRASLEGIRWEDPARDEAFLILALCGGALDGITGVVKYRSEFDGL